MARYNVLCVDRGSTVVINVTHIQVPFEVASTNQMRTVLVEARSVKVDPVRVDSQDHDTCMICMVNPINTIILPCGHQVKLLCSQVG